MNSYNLGSDVLLVFEAELEVGVHKVPPQRAIGHVLNEAGKKITNIYPKILQKDVSVVIPAESFTTVGKYTAIFDVYFNFYHEIHSRQNKIDFKITSTVTGKKRLVKSGVNDG
jgi:hypothetical protein